MTVHDSETQANAQHSPAFRKLTASLLRSPTAPREDREWSRAIARRIRDEPEIIANRDN